MSRGGPRVTVVSPHFDDAPLSLGQSLLDGSLSRCRVRVQVLFGRTNWTRWVHPTPGRARPVGWWRRGEETVASLVFGYRVGVDRWEEAVLRTGDLDPARLLDPGAPVDDDPLVAPLRRRLAELRSATGLLVVPAGLGDHVDHRLVSVAAGGLLGAAPADGRTGAGSVPIAFYEDRPYVSFQEPALTRAQLDRLGVPLEPVTVSGPVGERLHRRLRACYPSQLDELFVGAMDRDRTAGAVERLWFPSGTVPTWLRAVTDG